jgi:hypothetical protein
MRARARHQRGAVLLALLAVAGLGAAFLFVNGRTGSQANAAREQRTLALIAQAREALVGFALVNGRLPRPAVSAADGRENPSACTSDAACTGTLPWLALGIDASDSWGKPLRYSVTPQYTQAPVLRISAVGSKTVLTRDSGGHIGYLAGSPSCALASPCPVAIIWSAGRDDLGPDEAANAVATMHFMRRAREDGAFDDLLAWIDTEGLYRLMDKAGVLP